MKILVILLFLNPDGDILASRTVGAAVSMQQCSNAGQAAFAAILEQAGPAPTGVKLATLCVDVSKGERRVYGTEI